jgi:alanyl-tRNA synthetase
MARLAVPVAIVDGPRRTVTFEGVSAEECCGSHARSTAELAGLRVLRWAGVGRGVARVVAVVGAGGGEAESATATPNSAGDGAASAAQSAKHRGARARGDQSRAAAAAAGRPKNPLAGREGDLPPPRVVGGGAATVHLIADSAQGVAAAGDAAAAAHPATAHIVIGGLGDVVCHRGRTAAAGSRSAREWMALVTAATNGRGGGSDRFARGKLGDGADPVEAFHSLCAEIEAQSGAAQ